MNKTNLKQGTLAWEEARAERIGSSEVFDIVKYYSSDEELQNCGININALREEEPFTTTWALYHKMLGDGIYQRRALAPELSEYGHAAEPYGVKVLQKGRKNKLKSGCVYLKDRLIASLDIDGVSEEIDVRPFDCGSGMVKQGKKFVCEQKTMMPRVIKNGLPLKYIIQAQYQITMTAADFYILQIMELANDTVFERGKITGMSTKKMYDYLQKNMTVTHLYFNNNEHLAMLIKTCLNRFFTDVDNKTDPVPYIKNDKQRNIIDSIRINTFYNKDYVLDYDLSRYINAKKESEAAENKRKTILQTIIGKAKETNICKFHSKDGTTANFSSDGKFLIKEPKRI